MGLERQKLAKKIVRFYDDKISQAGSSRNSIVWLYEAEQLYYQLKYDLNGGYEKFIQYFDEASRAYHFGVRSLLLNEIEAVQDQYPPEKLYNIEIREARALLEKFELRDAANRLQRVIKLYTKAEQQVEAFILLGNVEIRRGSFARDVNPYFERAVEVSETRGLSLWLMRSLNALGWQSRLQGRLDWALELYERAIEIAIRLGEKQDQGWILNNIAFIQGIYRNLPEAIALCDYALEIWQEINYPRGIGACYEVYASTYRRSEKFDKAFEYYDKALRIFEPANDIEWLSKVYTGRGLAYWVAGRLDEAEEDLKKALSFGVKQDMPNILHQLSHTYTKQGKLKEAQKVLEQSYRMSIEMLDVHYEGNGLGDLRKLAGITGQVEKLDEFVRMFEEFKQRWAGGVYTNVKGRLLKYLGDLALQDTPEDVTRACEFYQQAFPLLTYRSYTEHSIAVQLQDMDELLEHLQVPLQQVAKLGKCLYAVWKEENLGHPEALRFLLRWMDRGGK